MEAVEFIRTLQKLCTGSKCYDCPLEEKVRCIIIHAVNPEESVRIVEEWATEHERQKAERERQKPEHPEEAADVTKPKQDEPCVKTIQDQLEGAIYREIISHKTKIEKLEHVVSVMRNNLAELQDKTYALSEKVYHTPTDEPSQTQEQKRTNKDVLLAAFPRMVMDGGVPVLCPRTMDRDIHIQYCAGRSCYQCRCEYWLSEVEE